jgi:RND superfamily putative drug exporter
MSVALYAVGRLCIRHRYRVAAIWLAALIGLLVVVGLLGQPTNNNISLPGSDSTRALDVLEEDLPGQANGTNPVVVKATHGALTSPANRRAIERTIRSLEASPYVRSASDPFTTPGSIDKDGRIASISVALNVGPSDLDEDEAHAIVAAEEPARSAGLVVATGGYLGDEISSPPSETSDAIGIAAAVVILLFTFGTVVAMGVPIVTAIIGLVVGLSAIGLLGHVVQVPTVGPILATMIGLGVGIDYSLFILTRHRGFMEQGLPVDEAAARAVATAGGAVVFAGGTVIIALLSLAVARIPIVTSLGYSAALTVAVAVLAATTLLPAVLSILGRRIDSLRVPFVRQKPHDDRPHGWARWARGVGRIPWPVMIGALALLLLLAVPVIRLELGQQDDGQLPKSTTSRQAYDLLAEGFGPGVNGPLLIAVDFGSAPAHNDQTKLDQLQAQQQALQQASSQPSPQKEQAQQQEQFLKSKASDPRLVRLQNRILKTHGVTGGFTPADVDKSGNAASFTAIPTTGPSAQETQDLVHDLRDRVIPAAIEKDEVRAYVGGQTAGYIDLAQQITDKLPLVIGTVIALSFVLLVIAFRSLLVPLTAALMNLLSVAAAYGVLTFVFQDGHGAKLLGLEGATPIVSFVPLLMFAILFGLSMDYQVFLLSRIQEHFDESHDNHEAVVDGLAVSARVITAAALIMVSVFASFVLNGDPTVKQFGLGLAVAIAIDATIVRCLLVPAVMVIFGKANWWLPGWLSRRLPAIGIEGEEYFEARDGAATAPAGGSDQGA